jgi:tetratricopeptide (TPR) repeat protein
MPDNVASKVPPPSADHRRIAVGQFDRANQVIATGNHDYGIRLLLSCCKLDPANLIYRQALRRTEKTKYRNNLRGHWLAWLTAWTTRAKMKATLRGRDYLRVLEYGEQILAKNPWDTGAQLDMAVAAESLGLLDVAIWVLEQARQKNPQDVVVNRALAALYEKRGNYTQAIALWEMVRRARPDDVEAQHKVKDLAANETIARGNYAEAVAGNASMRGAPPEPSPKTPAAPPPPELPPAPAPARDPGAGRYAAEINRLRAKIESDPTSANAYLHLASVYRRGGKLDEAREVLEQGLGPTGRHYELMLELADLDIEPFRRNLAIADEKLREDPGDEELRKIRMRLLKEINSRELDLYRQKADRFPTELTHRFELGVRLLRANQVDEAIKELQAARSDPRQLWRSLLYLGYCFKTRNNWRLAKRNFEESLTHLPPGEEEVRKDVLFQLATGSAEAGDLPSAIEVGHELANLDYGYREIGRLLGEWQSRQERASSAP